MNGRYGPYIVYKKQNIKIPKGKDAEQLTLEECREIISDEANVSKGTTRKRATKARSTSKKTTKTK
jgi:DNA topoisomerase-1